MKNKEKKQVETIEGLKPEKKKQELKSIEGLFQKEMETKEIKNEIDEIKNGKIKLNEKI